MSESEIKALTEGDWRSRQNTKGDSIQCLSKHRHAVVGVTSNIVDRKSAASAIKKSKDSTMTEDGWALVFEEGGRMGLVLRNEITVPRQWMGTTSPCQRCGAEFVLWLVECFLTSRVLFSREEVNYDSDDDYDAEPQKDYLQTDTIEEIRTKKKRVPRATKFVEAAKQSIEAGTFRLTAEDLLLLSEAKACKHQQQLTAASATPLPKVVQSTSDGAEAVARGQEGSNDPEADAKSTSSLKVATPGDIVMKT